MKLICNYVIDIDKEQRKFLVSILCILMYQFSVSTNLFYRLSANIQVRTSQLLQEIKEIIDLHNVY